MTWRKKELSAEGKKHIHSCINILNIKKASFYSVGSVHPFIIREHKNGAEENFDGVVDAIMERYRHFDESFQFKCPSKLERVVKNIKEYFPEETIWVLI